MSRLRALLAVLLVPLAGAACFAEIDRSKIGEPSGKVDDTSFSPDAAPEAAPHAAIDAGSNQKFSCGDGTLCGQGAAQFCCNGNCLTQCNDSQCNTMCSGDVLNCADQASCAPGELCCYDTGSKVASCKAGSTCGSMHALCSDRDERCPGTGQCNGTLGNNLRACSP
jgi:hypothetical protein